MSGETELKPCPFCLGSARTIATSQSIAGVDMVMCNGCGCRFYGANAEKWNLRVTPPGYEMVPEGTMDALRRATISLGELAGITQLNQYDYAALEACRKVLKSVAAKKETPNAQG